VILESQIALLVMFSVDDQIYGHDLQCLNVVNAHLVGPVLRHQHLYLGYAAPQGLARIRHAGDGVRDAWHEPFSLSRA
jgi:uncharacterized protein YfaA (DUF2138 family)